MSNLEYMKPKHFLLGLLSLLVMLACDNNVGVSPVEVFDKELKEYLDSNDMTYGIDPFGSPYERDNLLIKFNPGVTQAEKDALKVKYNVASVEDCVCIDEEVELWYFDPNDLDANGGVESRLSELQSESEPEEVEFNIIVPLRFFLFLLNPVIAPSRGTPPPGIDNAGPTVVVMDTGFDWDFDFSDTSTLDRVKYKTDAAVCPSFFGVDFANGDGFAEDDHGHGTHITGIIAQRSGDELADPVPYGAIPVKVFEGATTPIFKLYCGFEYARQNKVDFVNASFGWYNSPSTIIQDVISKLDANGTVVVTSAGNIENDNDKNPHYPSSYGQTYQNVISVTALNKANDDFVPTVSNFGKSEVDLAEDGEDILSLIPSDPGDGDTIFATGSSMSAAAVTGLLLKIMDECPGVNSAEQARQVLLNQSNIADIAKISDRMRLNGAFDEFNFTCN